MDAPSPEFSPRGDGNSEGAGTGAAEVKSPIALWPGQKAAPAKPKLGLKGLKGLGDKVLTGVRMNIASQAIKVGRPHSLYTRTSRRPASADPRCPAR